MTPTVRYTVYSDQGLLRKNNEDSAYAGHRLLAVADGMGGHAGGEIASSIAISHLSELDLSLGDNQNQDHTKFLDKLRGIFHEINATLARTVAENNELEGMGTTLTALFFMESQIVLTHIGDSRAYRLRRTSGESSLTMLTRDDTYVQTLVDTGHINSEQARQHPHKSLLMKALVGDDTEPELSLCDISAGDRFLLCSDGLTDVVSDEEILMILLHGNTDTAAQNLIQKALSAGAPDNITVLVADVIDDVTIKNRPVFAGAVTDYKALESTTISLPPVKKSHSTVRIISLLVCLVSLLCICGFYFLRSVNENYFLGVNDQKNYYFSWRGLENIQYQLFSSFYADLFRKK